MCESVGGAHPVRVTVDDRETHASIVSILQRYQDVEVTIRRLPLGDYEVDGRILFERKTLPDFIASIKDGRLFRQARRLASYPQKCIFILEGTRTDLQASKMRREAIQGALITITIVFGIPLLRSHSPSESVRLILYTARQLRAFATGSYLRHGKRPKGKRKIQLYILQGLPGVGPERALRLIEHFQNVQAVFSANADELAKIKGIGKQIAKKIRWAVGAD